MNILRFADLIAQGRVRGQRVFIRADLNVPQDDAGNITEDTRIRASVPCVKLALDAGAAVMVTSHLGRPKGKPEDKEKLDKEFKDALAKKEEKLKTEKAFAKWTYLVSKWTIDAFLKNRHELLADKAAENKTDAKIGGPEIPHEQGLTAKRRRLVVSWFEGTHALARRIAHGAATASGNRSPNANTAASPAAWSSTRSGPITGSTRCASSAPSSSTSLMSNLPVPAGGDWSAR